MTVILMICLAGLMRSILMSEKYISISLRHSIIVCYNRYFMEWHSSASSGFSDGKVNFVTFGYVDTVFPPSRNSEHTSIRR